MAQPAAIKSGSNAIDGLLFLSRLEMNLPVQQLQFDRHIKEIAGFTYIDSIVDNRRLIVVMALAGALLGAAYAFLSKPSYEANILIQLEEEGAKPSNVLGDLSNLFNLKTGATTEMEVLRSRMVVSRAVDNTRSFIKLQPKHVPIVGDAIARYNNNLSTPGFFHHPGYVWGAERAEVSTFAVPEELEGKTFLLTRGEKDTYVLRQDDLGIAIAGRIDYNQEASTPYGNIVLHVDRFHAKPGGQFLLSRQARVQAVESLQKSLRIAEKGKQSGVIGVSLEGSDPTITSRLLNEVGQEYIRQATERKAEEAKKSLAFLHEQLPAIKRDLEQSEDRYNDLRSRRGVLDLAEENRSLLQQSIQMQGRLAELRQKKAELLTRYEPAHPAVDSVEQQMRQANQTMAALERRIRTLPGVEQEVLRLERDVKINASLYTSLLTTAQQLRLVPTTKSGNARLLDSAVTSGKSVSPKYPIVIALSSLAGLMIGFIWAFFRKSIDRGISRPYEIGQSLGIRVVATIPHSDMQAKLYSKVRRRQNEVCLLADKAPFEPAVESLRGFRTSMQFLLQHNQNNVVLITGPTQEVGKSFVSANLAAVMGSFGMRVLLIDADIRTGQLQRYFGKSQQDGLTEILAGKRPISEVIQQDVAENVDLISAGARPAKPAEMLARDSFRSLLQAMSPRYDIILIDTAPVLATPDALIAGAHAGAIFCVARASFTTVDEVEETTVRMNQAGLSLTGVVFNDFRPSFSYSYGIRGGHYLELKPAEQ
jgi:tyrosine-protein kinase Etk/Wzc